MAIPHNSARTFSWRFCGGKRQFFAGILCVFQEKITNFQRKRSAEGRRRICAVLPYVRVPRCLRCRTFSIPGQFYGINSGTIPSLETPGLNFVMRQTHMVRNFALEKGNFPQEYFVESGAFPWERTVVNRRRIADSSPPKREKERGAHPALLSDQSALTAMTSRPL